MGNSWFRFRQFIVHQQKSAMKVTTDACLFGALQPGLEENGKDKSILDIGTGTGLLSLMVAQLNPLATITALEIEHEAASEAVENIAGSPYKNRIRVLQQDVLDFHPNARFQLVICNPPFHESQLNSPDSKRNKAHHEATFQLKQVFPLVAKWLTNDGIFSLLLPFYREKEVLDLAREHALFCQKLVRIRQTPTHNFFRSILFLGRHPETTQWEEITIRQGNNTYSPEFQVLLSPFYLNL